MKRLRQFALNTLLVVCGVILALIIAELVARQFYKIEGQIQDYNPLTGTSYKPNRSIQVVSPEFNVRYETNQLGLRGANIDLENMADCRVLGLGDSFTFGIGVEYEETYLEVMRHSLEQIYEINIQVINAGHGGWGTAQEAVFLEEYITMFSPQLIIVGITFNDVNDNLSPALFVMDDNGSLQRTGLVPMSRIDEIRQAVDKIPVYGWLADNSALMAAMRIFVQGLVTPNASYPAKQPENSSLLKLEYQLLNRIQTIATAHEAQVIFSFISAYDSGDLKVNTDLRGACNSEMLCVDVDDNFRTSGYALSELYFPADGHWTNISHNIAGVELSQYIREHEILKCQWKDAS